jgi:hypothetical protein
MDLKTAKAEWGRKKVVYEVMRNEAMEGIERAPRVSRRACSRRREGMHLQERRRRLSFPFFSPVGGRRLALLVFVQNPEEENKEREMRQ